MAEPAASWGAVLDELADRVAQMESGDLAALDGWTPPATQPSRMSAEEQDRARQLVARQHALSSVLKERQSRLVASRTAVRRPRFLHATPVPVYVDRLA